LDFAQISIKSPALLFVKVISFFLCQQVQLLYPGSPNVFGYMKQQQKVPSLPIPMNLIAFAHLQFSVEESGFHDLVVKVCGPDGQELDSVSAHVELRKENLEVIEPLLPVPMQLYQVGCYTANLEIDKKSLADYSVVLELASPKTQKKIVGFGQS
jgi:hypothetical protein